MVALPTPGSFAYDPANRHNSDMPALFGAWLEFARAMAGGSVEATYTISGGSITPAQASVIVDTSGGAANLDAIATTSLPLGWLLFLRPASSARVVTVRNGRGTPAQVLTGDGSDRVLTSTTMLLVLQRGSAGWREVMFWPGAATGTWQSVLGMAWAQAVTSLATQTQAIAGTDAGALISALTLRQTLVDKGWMQALTAFTGTFDATKWLLYDDGSTLWRVPGAVALDGAPHHPYTRTDAAVAGSFNEAAHGLGAKPRLITAYLTCNTADQGFAVGTDATSPDLHPYANTTLLGWTSASPIRVADGGGGYASITPARWSITNRAFV